MDQTGAGWCTPLLTSLDDTEHLARNRGFRDHRIPRFRDAIVAQGFTPAVTLLIGGHGGTGTFADLDNKADR